MLLDVQVLARRVRLADVLLHAGVVGGGPSEMVEVLDAAQMVVEVVRGVVVAEVELIDIVLNGMPVGPLKRLTASPGTAFPLILKANLILDLLVVGLSGTGLVFANQILRRLVVLVQLVDTLHGSLVTLEGADTVVASLL